MKKQLLSVLSLAPAAALLAGPVAELVDNRLGTDCRYGSCVLGPCLPHASAHPSPDSRYPRAPGDKRPDPTSGYHPGDPVAGFSQLHAQGTGGVPSYGNFRLLLGAERMTVTEARPYLFRARLDDSRLTVEIAPTAHGAAYRLTGRLRPSQVLLDRRCKLALADAVNERGEFTGNWNPAPYRAYAATAVDDERGLYLIAVSFASAAQAERYLAAELAGRDFEALVAAAQAEWERVLSRIRIAGVERPEATRFYTHLMHAFVQPRDRTADGIGWDDHYTLWDTWKTLFPLLALVDPQTVAGNVNSFAERFERSGRCDTCYTQGAEYRVGQGGDEADCVIADAAAKGIPGIDWARLRPLLESRWRTRTAGYRRRGYVSIGEHGDYCWRMQSGSGTMSFAWEDWCVGSALAAMGADGSRFFARSANWTNVWDASSVDAESGFRGFARARRADGTFGDCAPRAGYNTDFYEATSWEYSCFAPHDLERLMEFSGGKEEFVRRLEYALGHGIANFGNEPGFQLPWLFAFADRPDLTVRWARRVAAMFPAAGSPGDDDSGAMGSLYVFLQLGFFPIAGRDLYVLHGSVYPRIEVDFPATGRTLTVISENSAPDKVRLEAVYLNGRRLDSMIVRHGDLVAGGELRFVWAK